MNPDIVWTATLGVIAVSAIVSSIWTRGDKSFGLWMVTIACLALIAFN